jgi:hypothetical protein
MFARCQTGLSESQNSGFLCCLSVDSRVDAPKSSKIMGHVNFTFSNFLRMELASGYFACSFSQVSVIKVSK